MSWRFKERTVTTFENTNTNEPNAKQLNSVATYDIVILIFGFSEFGL